MDDYNHLPTAEEYISSLTNFDFEIRKYSEPKYQCSKCGGGMCRNEMIILPTFPSKREYKCNQCGKVDYIFG